MLFVCRRGYIRKWFADLKFCFTAFSLDFCYLESGVQLLQFQKGMLTISWKKNQACCSAASLTVLVLTTHCKASSSWSS